VPIWACYLVMV